jgi:iron complex outermembrane receptor protein
MIRPRRAVAWLLSISVWTLSSSALGADTKEKSRGFSARPGYGVRDLLVLVDGVPLLEADGFTRVAQLDLGSAERLEVIKGPSSALYGNAAFGGVLNVITRRGASAAAASRLRLEAGEPGFARALSSVRAGTDRHGLAYALQLSVGRVDGFRDHDDAETRRGSATLEGSIDESSTLTATLDASYIGEEIPSTLNRAQLESDPSQVRLPVTQLAPRRDEDRRRLRANVERQLGSASTLEGRILASTRSLDQPLYHVFVTDADRLAGTARLGRRLDLAGPDHRLTLGLDGDYEVSDNQRYANVLGNRGRLLLDVGLAVESSSLYAQDEIALAGTLSATVGVRHDRIRFALDDRILEPRDLTTELTFERTSPKLGVLWQPKGALGVYLNVASGFLVPTAGELTATGGLRGLNTDLRPQRARHAEVGLRATGGHRAEVELSLFQTDVSDEILPRTLVNGQMVSGNVARTRHRGAELGLDAMLPGGIEARLGYGLSENEVVARGAFRGNTLPGAPEQRGSLSLATRREGLNGRVVFERVGDTFLDDANTERQDAYRLLSASVTYDRRRWSVFLHGTNLTDERYASSVAVNDPFGNYFVPAPGRAIAGGVDVRF